MKEELNQQPENTQENKMIQNTPATPKSSLFEKVLACFIIFGGCLCWIVATGSVLVAIGTSQIWLSIPIFAAIFILLVYFALHKICKNITPPIEKKMSIAAGISGIVIAIGILLIFIFVWIDAGWWAALSGPVIILFLCGIGYAGVDFGRKVYEAGFKEAEKEFKNQETEKKDKSSAKDRHCEAEKFDVTTSEDFTNTPANGTDTEEKQLTSEEKSDKKTAIQEYLRTVWNLVKKGLGKINELYEKLPLDAWNEKLGGKINLKGTKFKICAIISLLLILLLLTGIKWGIRLDLANLILDTNVEIERVCASLDPKYRLEFKIAFWGLTMKFSEDMKKEIASDRDLAQRFLGMTDEEKKGYLLVWFDGKTPSQVIKYGRERLSQKEWDEIKATLALQQLMK